MRTVKATPRNYSGRAARGLDRPARRFGNGYDYDGAGSLCFSDETICRWRALLKRWTTVSGTGLMKARIHVITLAVADFERSLTFYRALGCKPLV
jgi:hypothetical protein